MRIVVTCTECNATWQSQSRSGRTRCRHCGSPVYVPVSVRHQAGLVSVGADPALRPRSVEPPREIPLPRAQAARGNDQLPSPAGEEPTGPSLFELIAPIMGTIAATTAKGRRPKRTVAVPTEIRAGVPAGAVPAVWLVTPGQTCPICRTGTTQCTISGCPMPSP
jgi:DNA-directed RNA polymerase subunit RPC12/RpoP